MEIAKKFSGFSFVALGFFVEEDSLDTFEAAQRQGILTREELSAENRDRKSHECIVLEEIANAQVIDPELFTKGSFFCTAAETRGQEQCAGCAMRTVCCQWQAHSLHCWPS